MQIIKTIHRLSSDGVTLQSQGNGVVSKKVWSVLYRLFFWVQVLSF